MSFGTDAPRADYVGNGSTASYGYGWRIFKATDLKLTAVDLAGVETLLPYLTDYTVANVGNFNGGTITLLKASLLDGSGFFKAGYGLTIRFGGATEQDYDQRNQGGLYPERIEDAIDRAVRFIQKVEDVVKRSFHLPETEVGTDAKTTMPSLATRISAFFAWDASGNPMAAVGVSGAPTSAFMATVLDDTTAAAAAATLAVLPLAGGNLTGGVNEARGNITQHATTMDFFTTTSPNILDGTGSAVTITACANAPQGGATRKFYPIVATVLTHGATFDIAGNANLTAAAGDCWIIEAKTVSTYRVTAVKEDGTSVVSSATTDASLLTSGTLAAARLPTLASTRLALSTGNITTTSTTLVDLTGATITFTTGAYPVNVTVSGTAYTSGAGQTLFIDVDIDGTLQFGTAGVQFDSPAATYGMNISFCFDTAALSAGSHTIKLQGKISAGTLTVLANSATNLMLSAHELR